MEEKKTTSFHNSYPLSGIFEANYLEGRKYLLISYLTPDKNPYLISDRLYDVSTLLGYLMPNSVYTYIKSIGVVNA